MVLRTGTAHRPEVLTSETLAATERLGMLLLLLHLRNLLRWRRGKGEHVLRERGLTGSAGAHLHTNARTQSINELYPWTLDALVMM